MTRWLKARLPRSGRRAEAGFTLIELLVTMAIVAVIFPLIMALLTNLQKQTATTVNTAGAVGDARLAMENLDFQVRSGSVSQDTGIGAYVVNSDTSSAPVTSKMGFWTGFTKAGSVASTGTGRCVQFAIDTTAGTLSSRAFAVGGLPRTRGSWTVVARHITAGSFFTATTVNGAATSAANPATQVVVHLRTQTGSGAIKGRISAIDSTLTLRNATNLPDTTTSAPSCATFT